MRTREGALMGDLACASTTCTGTRAHTPVDDGDVPGEEVEDSTGGGGVEECHGRVQNRLQHCRVQLRRLPLCPERIGL